MSWQIENRHDHFPQENIHQQRAERVCPGSPGYQQVTNAIKKTSTRDLNDLKEKGIVEQVGTKGPSVHYVIRKIGT
jgi:predicted HTH transcriptional regulator